jgi:hypothetical protein
MGNSLGSLGEEGKSQTTLRREIAATRPVCGAGRQRFALIGIVEFPRFPKVHPRQDAGISTKEGFRCATHGGRSSMP